MSDYGKHQTQRIMDSAAKLAISRYMEKEDAEKLQSLRESLQAGENQAGSSEKLH